MSDLKRTLKKESKAEAKAKAKEAAMRKKHIAQILSENKKSQRKTVQGAFPFEDITEDGICILEDKESYSISISFEDINYKECELEKKKSIYTKYGNLLNSFSEDMPFQLTLLNEYVPNEILKEKILIQNNNEEFLSPYINEFNGILENKLKEGNNSLRRRKILTITTKADSLDTARTILNNRSREILKSLNELQPGTSIAHVLNGSERIELMHDIFRQDGMRKDSFRIEDIINGCIGIKDFIAPSSLRFSKKGIEIGEYYARASFITISAPELTDEFIEELTSLKSNMIITINAHSVLQEKAIKIVRDALAVAQSLQVEENKKALKSGYDMDILPSKLKEQLAQCESFLERLSTGNKRMFEMNFLVLNIAKSQERLNEDLSFINRICQKYNCRFNCLDYQQEDGLNSIIPYGVCYINILRYLDTSTFAIFLPFVSQELFMDNSMYYGLNKVTKNLIMYDRRKAKNGNGFILGSSGSGKSFAAKREMISVLLNTNDDIVIIDPEGEYNKLTKAFHGQEIKISSNSNSCINPMDINAFYGAGETDPIAEKANTLLSLCNIFINGQNTNDEIRGSRLSILDRAIRKLYKDFKKNPESFDPPTLGDLYKELVGIGENNATAKELAEALEIYTDGSLNMFNCKTNLDLDNRLVVYNLKELSSQLKTAGLYVVTDQVWNRISSNQKLGKRTWIYIDEAHLFFKNKCATEFFLNLYKRGRKYGAIPTGITQQLLDLFASDDAEKLLLNCEMVMMFAMGELERENAGQLFGLSSEQLANITGSERGVGLLYTGKYVLSFEDKFPNDTQLFRIMKTDEDSSNEHKKEYEPLKVLFNN